MADSRTGAEHSSLRKKKGTAKELPKAKAGQLEQQNKILDYISNELYIITEEL